jgi:hypothetical protein
MNHSQIADLDVLVLTCRDSKARSYLTEAIYSYKAGAMRAATIATWIAVAFDFIDKINLLEAQGDKQAKTFAEEFRKIRETGDVSASLMFERQILDRAWKGLALISALEYEDLSRLHQDRHRCAHPSMISDEELYQPTAEQVRYHIRTAVTAMLSQPPTSGKAALEQLANQVSGSYFPTDKESATVLLKYGPLAKPRDVLVRNFIIVMLKTITSNDPSIDTGNRQRASAALAATRCMHPGAANAVLKDKLNDVLRAVPDSDLEFAFMAVGAIDDANAYLADDIRTRFSVYIKTVEEDRLARLVNDALQLTLFKDLVVERVCTFSNKNFAAILTSTPRLWQSSEVRKHAIEVYKLAGTFDNANARARLIIMPLAGQFSADEIREIVKNGFENSQIRYSYEFPQVLQALRSNPAVDAQWWDPFLASVDAERAFPGLFFSPSALETIVEEHVPSEGPGEDSPF